MARKIVINTGFITNSSSCVYHFDKTLLEVPKIKAFMKAYEIDGGFVGDDLWHRGECATVAINEEQKDEARAKLSRYDGYSSPTIEDDESKGVIVLGDEYQTIASELCHMLEQVAREDDVEGNIVNTGYFN